MIILGFDPGIAIVGFGVINVNGNRLAPVQYGAITTSVETDQAIRLKQIYDSALEIIEIYQPVAVSIEKLFFNKNITSAMSVGQARGVLMLAAAQASLPLFEYTPLQVKQALAGYGRADKRQIQEMVKLLLKLKECPQPDDVADALAIAICHAYSYKMGSRMRGAE
ncbi:MAG: crossover junction endodeoxyribonuclease RuvC [Anaerovoracaceae bacterium]|jgi:crossover junction endodeoxyribonuclease RuvC